jgi:hypothetical protein
VHAVKISNFYESHNIIVCGSCIPKYLRNSSVLMVVMVVHYT